MDLMLFNHYFSVVPIIIFIVFAFVIITLIVQIIRGLIEFIQNERSEKMEVVATVVAKRTHVSTYHNHNSMHASSHSTTSYFVTFQFTDGDRKEFRVKANDYGLLSEKDHGMLHFQGTRFLGFDRIIEEKGTEY